MLFSDKLRQETYIILHNIAVCINKLTPYDQLYDQPSSYISLCIIVLQLY